MYSSRTDGTNYFNLGGVTFGWETIQRVYQSDPKNGISRRVPGLKYAHVRDSWTRLNVLPAKIMQVSSSKLYTATEAKANSEAKASSEAAEKKRN